jgi:hypothetical protein
MIAFLKTGKYFQLKQDRENHKKFSAIHYKKVKRTINTPTRLAPSWAKKYSKLISTEEPEENSQTLYNNFWQRHDNDEMIFNKRFDEKKTSLLFKCEKMFPENLMKASEICSIKPRYIYINKYS